MEQEALAAELRAWIAAGSDEELREFCATGHPASVAEWLCALDAAEAWHVLLHAPAPLCAEIFSHLDEDLQVEIIDLLGRKELARLFSDLAPDDRADLFRRIPEEKQETVLPSLAQAEREDLRRLASYPEGSVGAVMTSDYATLTAGLTAAQAIEQLRREAPDRETIYYTYVVDENRRMSGFVSLKDLILAPPGKRIDDIMHRDVISARVDGDQEDAARTIQKFDLLALPVVNDSGALVGIMTHDDALDVITQEQTEDMEKLMAIGGSHEAAAYLRTSIWQHFKNRCGWIVALAAVGLLSGFIVQAYESVLLQFAILMTFLPMLTDTGGNTGSQASALVVRALALHEIKPGDVLRVLGREVQVALMIGVVLAFLAFMRVWLFACGSSVPATHDAARIGAAVALALGLQVVSATTIGVLLPMIAARLKLDPAVVASPAITTFVDVTGLLLFFAVAKAVLGV